MNQSNEPNGTPPPDRNAALIPMNGAVPAPQMGYGVAPPEYGVMDKEVDVRDLLIEYLRIFNKRKGLIAIILVGVLSIGAVRTLMQTPIYTATARIQIERNTPKVVETGETQATEGFAATDFVRTQIELLQSRAIAERVVSTLNLADDTDFTSPRGISLRRGLSALVSGTTETSQAPSTKGARARAAAGIVQGNRSVKAVTGSRLVDISYSDPNPQRAQRIAAAYVDAFIASNIDKRFKANSYAKFFLEDQVKQTKLRLEQSEKALLDFAQREQIVMVSEKFSIAENNLAAANASLGALAAERMKTESIWRQVENTKGLDLPQLLSNPSIIALRNQRKALETDYKEKSQTFQPSYPDMVQIASKIKEIDRHLGGEVRAIRDSLKAAYDAALTQENLMKERVQVLKGEVIDLQKRSVEYNILKREVDTNRDLHNGLLQRMKEVDVASGVQANNIFVVEQAEVPGSPSSPNLSRALMMAFVFGLAGGMAAAYVMERLDNTIHRADELDRLVGVPILGIIPLVQQTSRPEEELVNVRSPLAEAYRALCTSLQFSTESGLPKTLLITSSGPGEGKSLTSMAIAQHFATMGLKTLLIDADLRNSSLHKKLKLASSPGLSNCLTGACTPPEAIQATSIPNLAFLASGPLPPNAADLLGRAGFVSLLSNGLKVFDTIIIDGPPLMGLADAAILSNGTEATVFVAAAGQSKADAVRESLRQLNLARAPLIGAVLTKYDAKAAGYGYGYGYGYVYGRDPDAAPPSPQGDGDRPQIPEGRAVGT